MCWDLINETFTSVGTVGAVIVGMIAINRANKNSKDQIITTKLEELLELITISARYFGLLKDLYNDIENYRNLDNIETLQEYYEVRDNKFPKDEIQKLFDKLSRIEILARCYTNSNLRKEILEYKEMMYSFADLVSLGGNLNQQIKWKEGLPTYEVFATILRKIENKIIANITVK